MEWSNSLLWQYVPSRCSQSCDLPLDTPYNKMWKKVTKIIDSLHIKNHTDVKCLATYHPKQVKDSHPTYNLMCAEQIFSWLSRYKRITSSMNKTHHCFFIHRIVTRRNRYSSFCNRINRTALLPNVHYRSNNYDDIVIHLHEWSMHDWLDYIPYTIIYRLLGLPYYPTLNYLTIPNYPCNCMPAWIGYQTTYPDYLTTWLYPCNYTWLRSTKLYTWLPDYLAT